MKFFITSVLLFFFTFVNCQTQTFNKLSIDGNIGFVKPLLPLSKDFYTPFLAPLNTGLGVRYMLNDRFGFKGEFSFNDFNFKNDQVSFADTNLYHKSFYFRTSLVGVTNLGNILNFRDKTDKFGLLLHTGGGFSILHSKKTLKGIQWKNDFSDIMINLVIGLSPQYKINKNMALNLDLTAISHLFQTFTFDMNSSAKRQGFDGVILNISAGLSYYIGNSPEHYDWGKKW